MKKYNNLKFIFVIFVLAFFIINMFFLGIWYQYYIKPYLTNETASLQEEINQETVNLLKYSDTSDLSNVFSYLSDKYNVKIILQDMQGNVIYDNTNGVKFNEYLSNFLISINNKIYLINVIRPENLSYYSVIRNFIACELLIIGILALIGIAFASKNLLNPVDEIISDIKGYEFGKKPKKRTITGRVDYIQNTFVDLVNELEKQKDEQNRIISSISHDIKTPLTSIMGYTKLLQQKNLPQEDQEYLDRIYTKAINMKDIVSDFDDYLLSNQDRTYDYKDIALKDLIKNIKFEYEKDLKIKKIDLKIINKCKTQQIKVDVSKLKRVFSNIITNSIRYINDKGLIKIEIIENDLEIIFKISDNGKGVEEENLEKIFDPLFTTDKSRKISGLGLSICKEIITKHKGYIKAYNNKEEGLTIEFSINKNLNNS